MVRAVDKKRLNEEKEVSFETVIPLMIIFTVVSWFNRISIASREVTIRNRPMVKVKLS